VGIVSEALEQAEQAEHGDKEQQGEQQLVIDHMTQDEPRDRPELQDCFGRLVMIEVAVHKLPLDSTIPYSRFKS